MRRFWTIFLLAFALLFSTVAEDAFAKRSGGGRSSSRSSSRSKSNFSAKKRTPSKGKATVGQKTGWNKKKPAAAAPKRSTVNKNKKSSKVDKAAMKKAKANGTVYKNRAEAKADFKKKNAGKYKSSYNSKPSTRPGHIPQTTMVGGRSTTIIYNQGHGGYGYMGAMGTWMMYDAMADAAMTNRLMRQNNYVVQQRAPMTAGAIAVTFGGIIVVILLFVWIVKKAD